jgi:hypothetical protein
VRIFPSPRQRLAALARMGAHVVVYLLVIASAAVSGVFTVVPAVLLHLLLRWMGRQTSRRAGRAQRRVRPGAAVTVNTRSGRC